MKLKKELWIRADANKQIGIGHMMRCLTLAEAAKEKGIRTLFFTADEEGAALLKERGQAYRVLHTDFADMEAEFPVLCKAMEEEQRQNDSTQVVFLVDSYQITERFLELLKQKLQQEGSRLALFEDYGNVPYKVDILINYNIYGEDFSYEKNAPVSLLGCAYMPLRKVFCEQTYEVREKAERLLVCTGGSDPLRIAETLVGRLLSQTDFCLYVVCGRFSESLSKLRELEERFQTKKVCGEREGENGRLRVCTDVKEMWKLISRCDIAVSAAGTTLYELCAVGVPTVCFSFADNQILPGLSFAQKTDVFYAGDYEKDKNGTTARIIEKVKLLSRMPVEERKKIHRSMKALVDGRGAERLVEALWQE